MRRTSLLASLLLLLVSPAFAAGLVNGSFEAVSPGAAAADDPIPGWLASGSVRLALAEDDGFAAPQGAHVACFPAGVDRGTCLRQSFATVPGESYDVLFWLGSRGEADGHGHAALRVSLTGSVRTVAIDNPYPETLWQAHVVSFVAVDSVTTLAFSAVPRRGAVAGYLDGVVVRPAWAALALPPPGR